VPVAEPPAAGSDGHGIPGSGPANDRDRASEPE
jgi:hypothetical protein